MGNIKHANLYIIVIPEGEEKEKGIENVFEEIMAGNFPNLKISRYGKHKGSQRRWTQTHKPRYVIHKMTKVKETIKKQKQENKLKRKSP